MVQSKRHLRCFINPLATQQQWLQLELPQIPSRYVSPTKIPTATEGCYSNNYKNCIPDSFVTGSESCNKNWLSTGNQSNCVALWGECTGQLNSWCGPASCHGDDNYAICVPPFENIWLFSIKIEEFLPCQYQMKIRVNIMHSYGW